MERVWLSTSYYLDPAVLSLSEGAEVLFTRMIAYCGAAETLGNVTETALKTLGIRALNRKKSELLQAGLLHEVKPGHYLLNGWEKWQQSGDKLVKRQRSDRDRKARQREREAEKSRDMSRDVTGGEEKRVEEKRTTYAENASHVSNAGAPQAHEQAGPRVPVDGWRLVRDTAGMGAMPQATKTALALAAAELLHAGTDERHIRDALDLWMAKPSAGPGLLAHLVADVIKTETAAPIRSASTADQRVAAAQALKAASGDSWPPRRLELQ